MNDLSQPASLEAAVRKTVEQATASDIHSHLFPPSHGDLLLYGIDELLTYHYILSEMFATSCVDITPQAFFALPKKQQADIVWQEMFIRRTPLSEATRGVVETLTLLGLDPASRDLERFRGWFAQQKLDQHLQNVLQRSGLDYVVMTNDPFSAQETACWQKQLPVPAMLKTALRIDTLIMAPPAAAAAMTAQGYDAADLSGAKGADVARRFLADWTKRIKPMYMAASLPPEFAYGDGGPHTQMLDRIVLPAARELGLPLALMIGVRRQVNPALGMAGDGAAPANVDTLRNIALANPTVKFPVTLLSRVNQHEVCVTARKFANLHVFGCWWFCNQASIIQEMTRMRLEMLGTGFTAQHSDARVLDQLIYKWSLARRILADVLVEKYMELHRGGWQPTLAEIKRDVRALLGGSFEEFLRK